MGAVQGDDRPGAEATGAADPDPHVQHEAGSGVLGPGADRSAGDGAGADHSAGDGTGANPSAAGAEIPHAPGGGSYQPAAGAASVSASPTSGADAAQQPQGPYPTGPYPTGPYSPGPYPPSSYAPGPYPQPGPYPSHPAAAPPRPRGLGSWGAPAGPRTHRWGLGAFALAELVFIAVGGLFVVSMSLSGAQPTVGLLLVGLAAPALLAAGTALLMTHLRGNGPRIDLRLEWSWRDVGLGLAFGFGGLALTLPATLAYVVIVGPDTSSAVGDALSGFRAGPLLAMLVLLTVVIINPLCEEILYRGLLWGGVERHAGRWVAFAVTTVLFALAHFELTRTPLLLIVAIPIAVARLYTGRLLPAIVAHQVNNLLPGIMLALGLLGVLPMA